MPINGTIEEMDVFLKKNGLYREWQELFSAYVHLAEGGDLESIKRALFFYWYQCFEPNALSGVSDLDKRLTERVLGIIDSMAEDDELNSELTLMLPFYYSVCNWYLEGFQGLNNLLSASTRNRDMWQTQKFNSSFNNRGQLGNYWSSIGV